MPYKVDVPADCDYVLVQWYGAVTGSEMQKAGIEALKLAASDNYSKILVDASEVANDLSILDLYANTTEHARLPHSDPRAVIVGRPDQAGDLEFIETVGVNRGMPIKAFTNRADALDWLSK